MTFKPTDRNSGGIPLRNVKIPPSGTERGRDLFGAFRIQNAHPTQYTDHVLNFGSVPQVAGITFLDEQAVRNLVERYKDGGIDGLLKDECDGRSFKPAPGQRKEPP